MPTKSQAGKRKPKRKLTRAEKKQIAAAIERSRRDNGKPNTAQQTIPYQIMGRDGICRVTDNRYTKSIRFMDINYALAQDEDKNTIFGSWGSFINYFDSSIFFQITCNNLFVNTESFEERLLIKLQQNMLDSIRDEYGGFILGQFEKGNNGLQKSKYLTFGVEADDFRAAKSRLERIELDLTNNFRRIGVATESLDGKERLRILHSMFHLDGMDKFLFEWDWLHRSGLSTKDFIAPSSFEFKDGRRFRIGDKFATVSYLQILAPQLTDEVLKSYLDTEHSVVVNMHIQAIDQIAAIKTVKRKITDLDAMKIQEQKKAIRAGYDIDIIPSDLATYGGEAKSLLQELQGHNERMFLVTFIVLNIADTRKQLDNIVLHMQGIAQQQNCILSRLDYQQEKGLVSSLPLGLNQIPIQRGLTTSSTAIFIPFTTQELFQDSPEALYYGLNALSNNLIMVDRKLLKNPNGLILGTPGSGKSFAAKREITNVILVTVDDVIICDQEAEYAALVERLGGQVVRVSPSSTQYINPMDININYSDDDSPVKLKADFILSLCELALARRDGLQPVEKTVIDRVVPLIYRKYLQDPRPENMPILEDLYNALLAQEEPEAKHVATALEIYVKGTLNVFNHRTNVNTNNRLVCYDIKELTSQMKKLGMLIVQDQVWGRVSANRAIGKTTRYYVDEFHLLLREKETAAFSAEIWKRFRKWGGVPTAITQNVKDLLASPEIENIIENSEFILMLNQARGDATILANRLNISPHQLSYVTQSQEGSGLMFYGNIILPFNDQFPKNTELYRVMTTRPNEMKKNPDPAQESGKEETPHATDPQPQPDEAAV